MPTKLLGYLIIISIILNCLLAGSLGWIVYEWRNCRQIIQAQQINEKALEFTKLFVQKVMQGEKEISFEDRLKLENSIRALNDKKILSQWQLFTNAQNNPEAQAAASQLLILLIEKIEY